jgi:hypothetical protein
VYQHPLEAKVTAGAAQLQAAGLSWIQILTLVISFMGQFGPSLFSIVTDVITAVKTPGGPAAVLAALQALAAKDGPAVYQMATMIAGWFGIPLPPLPVA